MVFEIDVIDKSQKPDLKNVQNWPAVWRFRNPITIQHLKQHLNKESASSTKTSVLLSFMQKVKYMNMFKCVQEYTCSYTLKAHSYYF